MKITWLGHSAFRLEQGKTVVLIDPFLSGNAKFKGSVEEASAGVTHILLTHGHDDHIGDTVAIATKTNAQVVSNFEVCMFLAGQGVSNINPGNTGGTVSCGSFTVTFTQALHSSGTTKDGNSIYLGNPNGLIVKFQGVPVIYHMGDTGMFGDMALIDEIHQPKIGMVPVGDRFTMGGHGAAFALNRFFHFDAVFPCHYGTFDVLAPDASSFVAAMEGSKTRVHVPKIGESVEI